MRSPLATVRGVALFAFTSMLVASVGEAQFVQASGSATVDDSLVGSGSVTGQVTVGLIGRPPAPVGPIAEPPARVDYAALYQSVEVSIQGANDAMLALIKAGVTGSAVQTLAEAVTELAKQKALLEPKLPPPPVVGGGSGG